MSNKIKDEALAPESAEAPKPKALFGMLPVELKLLVESLGQKPYRAAQISEALYRQRVISFEEITVLPTSLREELSAAG